ncbi:charged multivesicular body protein 7 [Anthonomus grandis grandis]|uniref:charged multivesicular body protein 7 n=1 Tax=Anthonomus grandis grandis TaxID=2921223 RepID=UPI002165DDE9|nr:charged multivesicular body protein 7 [Anthonomus grandis grandis]
MFDIPEEKLPPCLKDDNRLNVLFAPLRNKSVNPKDWEDKISTWKTVIRVYCETNNVYCFTLASLNSVFVRHGRPPPCLNEVIADMVRNREVQPVEVFLQKTTSLSWSGWLSEVVIKGPLKWSYYTMKNVMVQNANGQYVHLDVVRSKSEELLHTLPQTYLNKIMSLRELVSLSKEFKDVEGLKLLLHHLEGQNKVSIKTLSSHKADNELDTLLLKFGDGVTPISEVDVAIHTLERNERALSKTVENLEDEIDKCVDEAKSHLKKKHKQLAKSCLVKKHQLEKQLDKNANALHNVQNCLEQLKGTHTNAHVWEAYKDALKAFDTTYKSTGISEEAVEDTMLQLGEVLDAHDDIQSVLARSPTGNDDVEELERELEELMASEENPPPPPPDEDDLEKRFNSLRIKLPEVPGDGSPDVSVEEAPLNH